MTGFIFVYALLLFELRYYTLHSILIAREHRSKKRNHIFLRLQRLNVML